MIINSMLHKSRIKNTYVESDAQQKKVLMAVIHKCTWKKIEGKTAKYDINKTSKNEIEY